MTLDNVKVGSVVIYSGGGYSSEKDTRIVSKITPTQIHLEGFNPAYPIKCRKSDGRVLGSDSGWGGYARIEVATPEVLDQIRKRKLASELAGTQAERWKLLPTDRLREICDELGRAVSAERAAREKVT